MTKEQFRKKAENFWYYYKIHTIVAIVVILVVGIMVKQCADRVEPDMTVLVVTRTVNIPEQQLESIENVMEKYTADVNGDGHKDVDVEAIYLGNDQDASMAQGMQEKLMVELGAGDSALYITDDGEYDMLHKQNVFFNLKKLDPSAPDSDKVAISSLPDLKIAGMPSGYSKLTLSVRSLAQSSYKKGAKGASYDNSVNVLKRLLKDGGQ